MKLSWFTSMGTQTISSIYDMNNIKQCKIREIELEKVNQMQTPRYVLRFEPLRYIPAFIQKDFHYVHTGPPTQGTSTREFVSIR